MASLARHPRDLSRDKVAVRRDGPGSLRRITTPLIGKNVRVRVMVKASQVAIDGEIGGDVHDLRIARTEPLQNDEKPAFTITAILTASNDTCICTLKELP